MSEEFNEELYTAKFCSLAFAFGFIISFGLSFMFLTGAVIGVVMIPVGIIFGLCCVVCGVFSHLWEKILIELSKKEKENE